MFFWVPVKIFTNLFICDATPCGAPALQGKAAN